MPHFFWIRVCLSHYIKVLFKKEHTSKCLFLIRRPTVSSLLNFKPFMLFLAELLLFRGMHQKNKAEVGDKQQNPVSFSEEATVLDALNSSAKSKVECDG